LGNTYRVEPAVHVPQADAAARQAGSRGDADIHVDSDVPAERGRRLVPANVFQARSGKDTQGADSADERGVSRSQCRQGNEEAGGRGNGVSHGTAETEEVQGRQDSSIR
jgi:hypothetical protein